MEKKGTVEANRVYLNIGSGDKKLEGFINIDMIPGADIQADVTKGLPFPDNSVDGIFSEHFIEHISQADGINFFRECRRVLKPGGRVRVATPDLDHIVQRYLSNDWKSESEMFNRGMEYVQNTCEQLNLSLRSWGHQWVYNEEELVRVATTAGLKPVGRCEWGKSDYPGFQGLEYRAGSRLIFEFEKSQHQYTEATPLVSILIPAYKPTYLEEALQSALQQTYPNVEIILCDDSGGKEIEKIVKKYLKKAPNLKYVKNPENIGGRKNYLQCFELAQGTFIKFLNDDDRLAPNCVERMVECFLTYPDITLVTSYRKLIDEQGNELPDQPFNTPIVNQDAIIEGLSLANAMLTHRINVVGEPTTTMFRKADALTIKPHIFSMGGRPALANGDVNLWVNLLGKGNAVYIVEPLSYFRLHDQQVQKQAEFQNRALKGWDQLIFDARRMGFLVPHQPNSPNAHPITPGVDRAIQEAQKMAAEDQLPEAIQSLTDLAKTYPRHALLLNELGTLHFFNNEPNLALMYFERAVEANPDLLNARRNLIDIYKMLGCLQEALQHLSYIIDHHPEDVEALLNLAHICESLERFDDALVFYGRLKELLPDNPEISQKIMEIVVKQNEGAESTTEENTLQNSHSIQESDKKGTPERHSASLPKVSIIIPVYNRLDMTRQCVDAIYSTLEKESKEIPFEIIVVDNNSTDGTLEFLEEKSHQHDNFYYLRFHNNTGFAHACNTGAYYAKGEYLLFLNNDTQPLDGWLSPLVQTLDVDKEVVATGSKLIYPDGTVQHAGVAIYDDRTVGDPLLPKHLHVGLAAEAKEVNEALTCKALTAACLMVRRKTFQEVGGFDEEYYNGYEDVDLCFKLFREGWKLVYQPRSCVVHFESQSGPERFRKVKENISRLHHQWLGKIQPDIVVQKNGKEVVTKHSVVRPYHLPGVEQTQQPVTEAKKETVAVEAPLTSIVILTYNQLHRTRECLESIVKHTREPYEVIVVDNGSSDGTVDYLRNWTKKHRNFRAIFNKTNKGFAAGNNQGIKKAKGDYIVLLNNDVVVSENWLEGMRKAFDKSPAVGLVGPMTNYISGHQLEPAANYQSLKEFEVFTREYSLAHKNQYVETFRLVGFCLMIKREVIDKIGLLDESFGLGNFEDDDFCLRASLEGYQLVIAREVFVHHYGNSSFKGNNIDYQKLLEKNRSIFLEKWKNLNVGNPLWIAHLVEKARLEEQAGNYEAQRWALEKAFSLNPENRQLLEMYENCLTRKGDTEALIQAFEKYLAHHPEDAEVANLLAVNIWSQGKPEEAIKYFRKAVEAAPENPDYVKNLADAYLEQENFEEAIPLLIQLMQAHPNDTEAFEKLANLYCETGDYKTAQEILDTALSHNPGDLALLHKRQLLSNPHLYIASQLIEQGELDIAVDLMKDMEKDDSRKLQEADLRMMGELYQRMGQQHHAQKLFQKADEFARSTM